MRPFHAFPTDSPAWLCRAGTRDRPKGGGKPPAAIGKANAPAPKVSDYEFDSPRDKMPTNSGSVYEPLSWEVRFFIENGEGIEALAEPIFVRAQPFNGWRTLRP